MKRVIKASTTMGKTEKLHKFVDFLQYEGVSEHTMLEYFFDNMYSEDCLKMMKGLADECDIDYSEEDYLALPEPKYF